MSQDNSGVVSIPETEREMQGEWLAFEVTEVDDRGLALRGRLVAHSQSRDEVDEVLLRTRPRHTYVVSTRTPRVKALVL